MLKQLRNEKLIAIDGKTWTILDPRALRKAAQYQASYVHLDRARREPNSDAGRRVQVRLAREWTGEPYRGTVQAG